MAWIRISILTFEQMMLCVLGQSYLSSLYLHVLNCLAGMVSTYLIGVLGLLNDRTFVKFLDQRLAQGRLHIVFVKLMPFAV